MEKKSITPLQAALIAFIVVFVFSPAVLAPLFELIGLINRDAQFGLVTALICGAFVWVFATLRKQRAHIDALHEQIDLLTDQANQVAEHINAMEGATVESPTTPEKD